MTVMPRIIDWPVELQPRAQEWSLFIPQVGGVAASGASFGAVWGMPRWRVQVDTPGAHASDLPQWQAFVLRLRAGVNMVRISDQRETGRGSVLAEPRRVLNLLRWTQQWQRWGRVGATPVSDVSGVVTYSLPSTNYMQTAERMYAGLRYVLVLELQADMVAHVALSMVSLDEMTPSGVIFDALTGEAVDQFGAVARSGAVVGAQGWRCWWEFRPSRNVQALVQVQPLLPAHGLHRVRISRPMVSVVVGAVPPAYVAAGGSAVWGDYAPVVNGAGQQGDVVNTAGWPAGVVLRAGYWLGIGGAMHVLLDAVQADDDGNAPLWIEPPLRRSPADGSPVQLRNVSGLFKLSAPVSGMREELHAMEVVSMTFEEVPQ